MSTADFEQLSDRDVARRLRSLRLGSGYVGRASELLVGRESETRVLLSDLEHVSEGSSAFRFIVGPFGAGKSLMLQWLEQEAHQRGMVVMRADLSPNARLSSTAGDARRLLHQLTQNTSTRSRPRGNAFEAVLDRFLQQLFAAADGRSVHAVLHEQLNDLVGFAGGPDMVHVIGRYVDAQRIGDEESRRRALTWLRGEYALRAFARTELGVQTVIDDADVFAYLRAFANFVSSAGYSGLVIVLDELTNLMRALQHPTARQKNLEQLLQIYNDSANERFGATMFVIGSTPDVIDDERRGLASYGALRRRLLDVPESDASPVLRLAPLTDGQVAQLAGRMLALWNRSAEPTCPASAQEIAEAVLVRSASSTAKASTIVATMLEIIAAHAHPELRGRTPSAADALTTLEL